MWARLSNKDFCYSCYNITQHQLNQIIREFLIVREKLHLGCIFPIMCRTLLCSQEGSNLLILSLSFSMSSE